MNHIITIHKKDVQFLDMDDLSLVLCVFLENEDMNACLATNSEGTTIEIDLYEGDKVLAEKAHYFVLGYLAAIGE